MHAVVPAAGAMLQFLERLKDHEKSGVPKGAGIDSEAGFDLGRMRRLVCKLGNPLSKFPVVHVAGTKGKGSTVAFISEMLRAAGYSVGTYTSPHIRSLRERIAVKNSISEEELDALFHGSKEQLLAAVAFEDWKLSHFEVLTALAFKYFADKNVDVAVVETGLGGARDATNVIEPGGLAAAVITSIGEEHLQALGGSLETIAAAKSGIIKEARPVVIGAQSHAVVDDILASQAAKRSAAVMRAYGDHACGKLSGFSKSRHGLFQICDFHVMSEFKLQNQKSHNQLLCLEHCQMQMLGRHQVDNALTSICTALCLREEGWNIPDTAIRTGLENAYVPGRFQVLSPDQVGGSEEITIVLDGAHTDASAAALATTLRWMFPDVPLIIVCAMASDKDHSAFAARLLTEARPMAVFLTEVDIAGSSSRSVPAEVLRDAWTRAAETGNARQITISMLPSVKDAVKQARQLLLEHHGGLICITGSMHAVAAADPR